MYLYLDLIWALNFCIDYLLLWMTGYLRKQEYKRWRLVCAALVGSAYVLFLFFPPLHALYTLFIKLLLSLLIVLIAFGYGQLKRLILNFLMFYFVSFITGGGIFALHFILQSQHELLTGMLASQGSGYGDPLSWLFVVVGFSAMLWFTRIKWHTLQTTKAKEKMLISVDIFFQGRKISCTGLVDTGNQLYDPLTKNPVMFVDQDCFQSVLPSSLLDVLAAKDGDVGALNDEMLDQEWGQRLRVIPYRGVKEGFSIMFAIKPDKVILHSPTAKYQSPQVYVGINPYPLSSAGGYQAILHPDQVKNLLPEEALSCS